MNIPLGDTYYFKFTTRSFSTGVPTTLSGTPALSVYEENNLTQITTGVTLTADYDSVTGLNDAAIVATSGNGYEVGKYYDVVITTGTVGGVSVVGEVVGHFRVMAAEGVEGVPDVNTTHVSDTAQTANDNGADINTILSRVIGTIAAGTHNAQSGDSYARIGANGASLSAIPYNSAWDADIQSECNDALVAFFTSAANLVDLIWDEAIAGHLTAGTSGLYMALAGGILVDTTITGTPTSTTFQLTAGSTIDDFYNDQLIYIISGTGLGQVRAVKDYTGATKLVTVDEPWITTPAAADRVVLISSHVHPLSQILAQVNTALDTAIPGSPTAGSINDVLKDLDGLIPASGTLLNDASTFSLPAQGAPTATPTLDEAIMYLYKFLRNKTTQTATTLSIYDDAGTTVDHKATVSDDGSTATRGEIGAGP